MLRFQFLQHRVSPATSLPAMADVFLHQSLSQQQTLAPFYSVRAELFRAAPEYVFTQPPAVEQLFYEWFDWGMNGARFRELAGACLAELGLDEPL